ncbi:hypothetical protein TIFTF001_030690 [Ficus carica]|uniref:Helicase C-terminal domain-containing protein n=1 Tax=Ficus carica TaxID=3494 RepID=A0AA88J460_FICCA|nr:hypothetical protein TIFTF001_030690 [Ficus carica]
MMMRTNYTSIAHILSKLMDDWKLMDELAVLRAIYLQMHLAAPSVKRLMVPGYRIKVLDEFRKSNGLILVTSNESARGVDYPDVTLVIQVRKWTHIALLKCCFAAVPG